MSPIQSVIVVSALCCALLLSTFPSTSASSKSSRVVDISLIRRQKTNRTVKIKSNEDRIPRDSSEADCNVDGDEGDMVADPNFNDRPQRLQNGASDFHFKTWLPDPEPAMDDKPLSSSNSGGTSTTAQKPFNDFPREPSQKLRIPSNDGLAGESPQKTKQNERVFRRQSKNSKNYDEHKKKESMKAMKAKDAQKAQNLRHLEGESKRKAEEEKRKQEEQERRKKEEERRKQEEARGRREEEERKEEEEKKRQEEESRRHAENAKHADNIRNTSQSSAAENSGNSKSGRNADNARSADNASTAGQSSAAANSGNSKNRQKADNARNAYNASNAGQSSSAENSGNSKKGQNAYNASNAGQSSAAEKSRNSKNRQNADNGRNAYNASNPGRSSAAENSGNSKNGQNADNARNAYNDSNAGQSSPAKNSENSKDGQNVDNGMNADNASNAEMTGKSRLPKALAVSKNYLKVKNWQSPTAAQGQKAQSTAKQTVSKGSTQFSNSVQIAGGNSRTMLRYTDGLEIDTISAEPHTMRVELNPRHPTTKFVTALDPSRSPVGGSWVPLRNYSYVLSFERSNPDDMIMRINAPYTTAELRARQVSQDDVYLAIYEPMRAGWVIDADRSENRRSRSNAASAQINGISAPRGEYILLGRRLSAPTGLPSSYLNFGNGNQTAFTVLPPPPGANMPPLQIGSWRDGSKVLIRSSEGMLIHMNIGNVSGSAVPFGFQAVSRHTCVLTSNSSSRGSVITHLQMPYVPTQLSQAKVDAENIVVVGRPLGSNSTYEVLSTTSVTGSNALMNTPMTMSSGEFLLAAPGNPPSPPTLSSGNPQVAGNSQSGGGASMISQIALPNQPLFSNPMVGFSGGSAPGALTSGVSNVQTLRNTISGVDPRLRTQINNNALA